jgi:hypothetical protein
MSRTDLLSQSSGAAGNFGTGNFVTNSFTPPDNSLLVVSVTMIENNGTTTDPRTAITISGGGWTYTKQIDEVSAPTSFPTATLQYTAPVGTGASMTLTLGAGGRAVGVWFVSVSAETGYDTATPVGTTGHFQQNGGFAGPPTPITFNLAAPPASGSEVIAALGADRSTAGATPGTGWTEITDVGNTDWGGLETEARSGSTSQSVDWIDGRPATGTRTATVSTAKNWFAVSVLLKNTATAAAPVESAYKPWFIAARGRLISIAKFARGLPNVQFTALAIDVTVADDPVGIRVGVSSAGATFDVLTPDAPLGVRTGVSATTVSTDVFTVDQPAGVRVGVSSATATTDVLVSDTPRAVRVGLSSTNVSVDVLAADSPSGIRLGVSSTSVTADIGSGDTPQGIRVGISATSTTIDQLIADAPVGIRVGVSSASAGAEVFVVDPPNGIRLGVSSTSVTIDQQVADVPRGVRIGISSTSVTTEVFVADSPSGIRVGSSPSAAVLGIVVTDLPNAIRLGISSTSVSAGAVNPDVFISDVPRGIRVGASPAAASIAYIPDVYVTVGPASASADLGSHRASANVQPDEVSSATGRPDIIVDLSPKRAIGEV